LPNNSRKGIEIMENISNIIFYAIWAIATIAVWVLYHQIFHVVYFNLCRGCMAELFGCGIVAILLLFLIYFTFSAIGGFILKHWILIMILALIAGVLFVKSRK
jgi:hypothetical protein